MRSLFVLLFASSLAFAQDDKPITLTPEELDLLASEKAETRIPILKKIDGKIIKLTGTISGYKNGGFTMAVPTSDKKRNLTVGIAFVEDKRIADYIRTIEYNTGINQPGRGTIYVLAKTSASVERPTADYKIPENLKPRPRPAPVTESLEDAQRRIQAALIEQEEAREKIMEDARKKGKLETVTVFQTPAPFKDAAPDVKYLPKPTAKKE